MTRVGGGRRSTTPRVAPLGLGALLLLACLAGVVPAGGEARPEVRPTPRGQLQIVAVGPLEVSYLSGRDAGAQDPVFDMSMGEISLRNTENRPVHLEYDSLATFFAGHLFDFGRDAEQAHRPPLPASRPDDFESTDLAPGASLTVSRQDLVANLQTLGRATFLDGHVCTRFEGRIRVDGEDRPLSLGPICFRVDMDRDWDREIQRHTRWNLERAGVARVE